MERVAQRSDQQIALRRRAARLRRIDGLAVAAKGQAPKEVFGDSRQREHRCRKISRRWESNGPTRDYDCNSPELRTTADHKHRALTRIQRRARFFVKHVSRGALSNSSSSPITRIRGIRSSRRDVRKDPLVFSVQNSGSATRRQACPSLADLLFV